MATLSRLGSATTLLVAAVAAALATCSSPGDPCGSDSDCGGNLICYKLEVDGGPSESGICTHARVGLGGFCRLTADCADDLLCSNELPAATKQRDGTCVPLRTEGESCADNAQCQPPLECQLGGDQGACRPPPPDPDAGVDDAAVDDDAAAMDAATD